MATFIISVITFLKLYRLVECQFRKIMTMSLIKKSLEDLFVIHLFIV